jgi:hypothetical protein
MSRGHKEFDFIAEARRMVKTFYDQLTKDLFKWVSQEMLYPPLKMELSPLELTGHVLTMILAKLIRSAMMKIFEFPTL